MRAFARAVPVWAWLAAIVAVSAAIRFVARARDGRAVDHGRRAHLLRAREELRGERPLRDSRRARRRLVRLRLPAADQPGVPAVRLGAGRVRRREGDQLGASCRSRRCPRTSSRAACSNRPFALAAAALSVAIPSLLYTGTLMTENAFYPVFLCVALVLVRMLERPTRANQLGAARALRARVRDAAAGARALPGGADGAAAARAAPARALPHALRRHGRARGRSRSSSRRRAAGRRSSLLGAYETAGQHGYSVGAVAKWLLWHVAELDLYLGVVPVAAFVVLAFAWRSLDAPQRAFMAGAAALTGWLLLEVAAFATLPGVARVEERNMFYVAPLFLIALLLWVQLGAPRPRLVAAAVGGRRGAARRDAAVPAADRAGDRRRTRSRSCRGGGCRSTGSRSTTCGSSRRCARSAPRRCSSSCRSAGRSRCRCSSSRTSRVVQQPVAGARGARLARRARRGHRPAGRTGSTGAVGGGRRRRGVLWAGRTDPHVVWENEFFNRSVGPVYDVGRADPGQPRVDAGRRRQAAASCGQPASGAIASQRRDARPARREARVRRAKRASAVGHGAPGSRGDAGDAASTRTTTGRGGSSSIAAASAPAARCASTCSATRASSTAPQTVRANGTTRVVFPGVRTGDDRAAPELRARASSSRRRRCRAAATAAARHPLPQFAYPHR